MKITEAKTKRTLTKLALLLGASVLAGGALVGPGRLGAARVAQAEPMALPGNQAELDAFAQRSGVMSDSAGRTRAINRAAHAFDAAGLFWFTDLDAARAQAKREGKPILALRLLGNLSDEYSCANSRLFRVLLYPNAGINRLLHDRFVLFWSSERPVPVVTIDMGDGRTIKRTLTGNSAHYLLDSDGQPLDVLPGLYAPAEFEGWLQGGLKLEGEWRAAPRAEQPLLLSAWHRARLVEIALATPGYGGSPQNAGAQANRTIAANPLAKMAAPASVDARSASALTETKMVMEMPILGALPTRFDGRARFGIAPVFSLTQSAAAAARPATVKFDDATRARIAAMQPSTRATENQMIQTLEQSVARDTQNNRRNFEPAIHAYFVNDSAPDFTSLNRAIYDKLFLTPASDPWLGLNSQDAFIALGNGGLMPSAQPAQQQKVAQRP